MKGVLQLRTLDQSNRLSAALGIGAKVVELRVVRTPLRTEVHVVVKHPERSVPLVTDTENPVGIDMGLKTRMTLSTGEHIPARTVDRTLIRRTQRKVSRAKKVSLSRRKKVTAHAKVWRRGRVSAPTGSGWANSSMEYLLATVMTELANTTMALHSAGVAHHDIKPENISVRHEDDFSCQR